MARGGKGGARRGRIGGSSYGTRISKPQTDSSKSSGPKPMDIDNKMSQSLDDIIKKQRVPKKTQTGPKPIRDDKGKNLATKKGGENRKGNQNIKQRPQGKRVVNSPVKARNIQITVRADKIRDRPILNQIISHAESLESQRAARHVAPRLRERVQPVSLDYKVSGGDHYPAPSHPSGSYHAPPPRRHDDYLVEDRQGHHQQHHNAGTSYSRVPPPAAPMNIDSYYQEPPRTRRY